MTSCSSKISKLWITWVQEVFLKFIWQNVSLTLNIALLNLSKKTLLQVPRNLKCLKIRRTFCFLLKTEI
jgi:hypothetical protein